VSRIRLLVIEKGLFAFKTKQQKNMSVLSAQCRIKYFLQKQLTLRTELVGDER